MLKPTIYWILFVIYGAFIFYLSSGPIPVEVDIPVSDKLGHMVEFGIFSFLLYNALRSSLRDVKLWKIALMAIIFSAFYGVSDEIHQSFVPTRSADPYDIVADASGSIIMQGLIYIRMRFFV